MKNIIDLCGGTGSWSQPYKDAGYNVIVVDPADDIAATIKMDVRLWSPDNNLKVHGILAAPPCTHLSVSGARWWRTKGEGALLEALSVVDACIRIIFRLQPEWWSLENPVGRLTHYLGKPRLIFNPCDYGDPYTKRTCLWGSFNVPIQTPVTPIKTCEQGSWVQQLGGKTDKTKRLRSITPQGFANAFFKENP